MEGMHVAIDRGTQMFAQVPLTTEGRVQINLEQAPTGTTRLESPVELGKKSTTTVQMLNSG